jgi:hypothetical protein
MRRAVLVALDADALAYATAIRIWGLACEDCHDRAVDDFSDQVARNNIETGGTVR